MNIPVKHPVTLLELLLEEFGSASRTTVKNIISHGNIRINKLVERNSSTKVAPDDKVEYIKEKPTPKNDDSPFPILYEDRDLLVTVKPPGLLTYGDRGTGGTSLYKILSDYIKEKSEGKERLFCGTSPRQGGFRDHHVCQARACATGVEKPLEPGNKKILRSGGRQAI